MAKIYTSSIKIKVCIGCVSNNIQITMCECHKSGADGPILIALTFIILF